MNVIDCHTHINFATNNTLIEELNQSQSVAAINIIAIEDLISEQIIEDTLRTFEISSGKEILITASVSEKKLSLQPPQYFNNYPLLKIHPRLQKLTASDIYNIFSLLKKSKINKPVIIDMFPYRNEDYQINNYFPLHFESILHDFPEYTVVFAHFGGIYIREVFMMMKCYPNLWTDTSLISRYFLNSPIEQELYYFIKRLEGQRVLYGSDYPELKLDESYQLQKEKMIAVGTSEKIMEKVFYQNFKDLLNHE